MKFGAVNKSTDLFFILYSVILAVIIRKRNIKLGILKGGTGKEPYWPSHNTAPQSIYSFRITALELVSILYLNASDSYLPCLNIIILHV